MTRPTSEESPSRLFMPAMPPPQGMHSNFANPDTNAKTIRILNGILPSLAVILLLVRLFIRTTLPKGQKLGWDDGFCAIAVVMSTAHTVLIFLVLDSGYGRHLWDVQAITITHGKLVMFAVVDMVYVIAIFLIKFSILLLYHRLFAVYISSKRLIISAYVFIAFIMAGTLGNSIARVTTCTDIQKSMVTPFCYGENVNIVLIVVALLNTIADFYILAIPVHRVVKMYISWRKKIGVLMIFLGGIIACTMSLVRLVVITQNLHSPDVLWNGSRVTQFTIVEMNLGIICSCMMFVPTFFSKTKVVVYSMRFAILSRTETSLRKVGSAESQPHALQYRSSLQSQEIRLDAWEEQACDLELLTKQNARAKSDA